MIDFWDEMRKIETSNDFQRRAQPARFRLYSIFRYEDYIYFLKMAALTACLSLCDVKRSTVTSDEHIIPLDPTLYDPGETSKLLFPIKTHY